MTCRLEFAAILPASAQGRLAGKTDWRICPQTRPVVCQPYLAVKPSKKGIYS
jgi:hypothetical protein